ncbi:LytR/AlgR family response regulator transcription factor [Candidatus Symbiothrix dinenymphae]|uniref:LytR/AlgR family response regulator transcription factor n=1 Tax=Candidatus Symbiothrix dinenymphae TaxID=467085 RepID=UPI0006C4225A|nr:LytTR family DNA-binding domain-containing protein [Candidatus Symbiothrix dinenymphae]GAP71821.1 two-component system response regulator [Candidatus Symbiothrix dinenymphae]
MIRCIAIDDEPLALKLLTQYCSQVPSLNLLGAYSDSVEGLCYIKNMEPDLIFLDIQMPDLSGIQIAKSLNKKPLVIFTTAYEQYAIAGFELDVVDYLLKPFDFERFLKAYTKAEERLRSASIQAIPQQTAPDEILSFKCRYQTVQLPLNTILYIEACDNYIKIITPEATYMPAMSMKSIQKLLPEPRFIRVHNSYIIPIQRIKSFNREKVTTDKIQIPIGRAYSRDFFQKMNAFST